MKRFGLAACLVAGLVLALAFPAQAEDWEFEDTYWGGDTPGTYTDVIGQDFDIDRIEVSTTESGGFLDSLTVTFYTPKWAQKWFDDGAFNTFPEDIFIDLDGYVPPSLSDSLDDNADDHVDGSGDPIWDLIIHVDDNGMADPSNGDTGSDLVPGTDTSGDTSLYIAEFDGDLYESQEVYVGNGNIRENQHVRYVPGDNEVAAASGGWELIQNTDGDYIGIEYTLTDLEDLEIDFSQWSLKYSVTCANDVIFITNVPEPGSALLLLGGLAAGIVARRRRKAKVAA